MNIWSPAEDPRTRSARSWFFDAAVALFAVLTALTYVTAAPDLATWVAALVIVVMAAPLLVRRVWPVPVFGWALLVAAATGWWAMQVVWAPALVISLYTVAVLRPRREAIVAALLLTVGVVVSTVHIFPGNWAASAASLIAVVVAATVLGLYIRTRRDLLEQLRERAQRVERDRDQQVALAAAEERARIAREMHDIVAHHLTVMVTLSEGAAATTAGDPERAAEAMRAVSATGRLALADTRRLLGVLRDHDAAEPPALAPLPGAHRLDDLVDRVRTAGLTVRYAVEGAPPADASGAQLALYRIVQEALTNTMRHSGPGTSAAVTVTYRTGELRVEVADDGAGTTPNGAATTGAGRGLIGMRERVEAFHGELRSGPRPQGGWLVAARLPVPVEPSS